MAQIKSPNYGEDVSRGNLDKQFGAIWRRALQLPDLNELTPELVGEWGAAAGLQVESVEVGEAGAFVGTPGIVLSASGRRACFPTVPHEGDPSWERRRQVADRDAETWEKLEWFWPFWVPVASARKLLSECAHCSKERAAELFNYHTSTLYTLPFQAVCIAQIMPTAQCLEEFVPIAREAYLAFYSGYRAAAIAALIPAIEGALSKIVPGSKSAPHAHAKVDRVIDGAVSLAIEMHFGETWVPKIYRTREYLRGHDERVFVFESVRRWLKGSFFSKTDDYAGATGLNRNHFAHATSTEWQQGVNFRRLIIALTTLGVVESWHNRTHSAPTLFPEMNEDGRLLWQQALFQGNSQAIRKLIEERFYHEHGRMVPEYPTDDGVELRKALLAQDCVNDIVRPLRDAGWDVTMAEPDEHALYVTVLARDGSDQIQVSLLYSCATESALYVELARTSVAILYRGAPFHQDSFARNINVHVGPAAGWQPPSPPSRHRNA